MPQAIRDAARALAREGFAPHFGSPEVALSPDATWQAVRATGTVLWLDTGDEAEIRKLFTAEFSAVTTNNTLLNAEIQKGIYDAFVPHAARVLREADPKITQQQLLLEIAFVLNAKHALRLVSLFDARVSVELHTDLAHDVASSIAYGRRYYEICPERFIIKIPFTPAGLLSARQLVLDGIPVNFTLGFSARQNHLIALFTNPNWVNVFMGRLNAFVADNKLGTGDNVGEKATLATQRALDALRAAGRSQSHLIGASMRAGAQVATLAGLDVFTMPPKVAAAYHAAPVAQLRDETANDPAVAFSSEDDFGADTLWEISDEFRACVESLLQRDPETLGPEEIIEHFDVAGLGGFFPRWTDAELRAVRTEGKIPRLATWQARLADGGVDLDALLNMAALQSFVGDQAALDQRVASFL